MSPWQKVLHPEGVPKRVQLGRLAKEPYDLREVRRIVLDRLRGREARVYLYGSGATGRNRRSSDIDVGIISKRRIPIELWWEIKEALENSLEVDLVDLAARLEDGPRSEPERAHG